MAGKKKANGAAAPDKLVAAPTQTSTKAEMLPFLWEETNTVLTELREIHVRVGGLGHKLTQKYKQMAALLNEDLDVNNFIQFSDKVDENALYYCFDPLYTWAVIFFIPDKVQTGFIPIHAYLKPKDSATEQKYNDFKEGKAKASDVYEMVVNFNPFYHPEQLVKANLTIVDVLVPYKKVPELLLTEEHAILIGMLKEERGASDPIRFNSWLDENLFRITQFDRYRKQAEETQPAQVTAH